MPSKGFVTAFISVQSINDGAEGTRFESAT